MRVTLNDNGNVWFDSDLVGTIDDTNMRISDYEKLQAYIAAANEAFDAIQMYVDNVAGYDPFKNFYKLHFEDILQKVGD